MWCCSTGGAQGGALPGQDGARAAGQEACHQGGRAALGRSVGQSRPHHHSRFCQRSPRHRRRLCLCDGHAMVGEQPRRGSTGSSAGRATSLGARCTSSTCSPTGTSSGSRQAPSSPERSTTTRSGAPHHPASTAAGRACPDESWPGVVMAWYGSWCTSAWTCPRPASSPSSSGRSRATSTSSSPRSVRAQPGI